MQPNQLKPGIVTSEFLGTLTSMLIGVLVLFKILPIEQAAVFSNDLLQFLNLCVQIFTLAGSAYIIIKPLVAYIQGRVVLKAQQLQQSIQSQSAKMA